MAVDLEEILLRMGFNSEAVTRGTKAMLASQRAAADKFSALWQKAAGYFSAAFATAKAIEFERGLVSLVKTISLTAERLGITTDEVQKLQYASTLTGVELDKTAAALDRLAKAKQAVLQGGKGADEMAESFRRFGISVEQIAAMTPYELFNQIAASVEKTGASAEVTSDAMQLFGRSGGALIPLLKELRQQTSQAPIISEQDIENIRRAGEALEGFKMRVEALAATVQMALLNRHYMSEYFKEVFRQGTMQPSLTSAMATALGFDPTKPLAKPPAKTETEEPTSFGERFSGSSGAGGRAGKLGDLYTRRAELQKKLNQLSRYSLADLHQFGEELNSIRDQIAVEEAPDEESRLKVKLRQVNRDLGTQKRTLVPEAGIPAYRSRIDQMHFARKGIQDQLANLQQMDIEKLALHAEKHTLALERLANAVNGNAMRIDVPD
jgi:hypothetical protein